MKLFIITLLLLTANFANAGKGPFGVIYLEKYLAKSITEQEFREIAGIAFRGTLDKSRILRDEEQIMKLLEEDIPGKAFKLELVAVTDANNNTRFTLRLSAPPEDSKLFAEMQSTLSGGRPSFAVPEQTENGTQWVARIKTDAKVMERLEEFFRKVKGNEFAIDVQKTRPQSNVVEFRPRGTK